MTFADKLKAAGFPTKKAFAEYMGYSQQQVSGWGEKPPLWVDRHLCSAEENIKLRKRVAELEGVVSELENDANQLLDHMNELAEKAGAALNGKDDE